MKKTFFWTICILLLAAMAVPAQQKGTVKAVVKEKQTIRDIAKEYLNDADLWEEIIRSNNLKSPADVKPGMTLTISCTQIIRSKSAADEALVEIQKASAAGARSFAAELIDQAVLLHSQSLKERKNGNWEKSFQLAVQAKQEAINAYQESAMKNSAKGEAVVTYTKGKVENKKPAESLWKTIAQMAKLLENDKVRTLSDSYAEISFLDKSRIRLSENSQAVIQRNRVDLLRNASEAKVSLEKGDAFALLTGGQGKRKFNLEVPGLETTVRSKAYWVNKDEKSTKVANYDGEIELKSKSSKVTLKTNQGSTLLASGKITDPKDLLKQPVLSSPASESVIYADMAKLEWQTVANAGQYWLVVARDASFKSVAMQQKNLPATSQQCKLDKGVYYWKVAAIDKDGFPGPFSEGRSFTLISDNEPPYIALNEPLDKIIVTSDSIKVSGVTESKAKITVNGAAQQIDANSRFNTVIQLKRGENKIVVEAVDLNNNKSTITRTVQYEIGREPFVRFDLSGLPVKDGKLYSPTSSITLKGQTVPNSAVYAEAQPKKIILKTKADSTGAFELTVSGIDNEIIIQCVITTPENKTASESLKIIRDQSLPHIMFKYETPYNTNDEDLVIAGKAQNAVVLKLNGTQLITSLETFQTVYKLKEGKNLLVFEAINENGNYQRVQREVILDTKPPELTAAKVIPPALKASGTVAFEVKAVDESGLKRTAKIVYQNGDDLITLYLKYEEIASCYKGSAYVPVSGPSEVKIRMILLEDQLGNSKEYNFFEK